MENEDLEPCPEEGFHRAAEDGQAEQQPVDGDPGKGGGKKEVFEGIIDHCRHFVSMVKRPQWQILSLDIIAKCMNHLAADEDILLPLVHLTWQPLKLILKDAAKNDLFLTEKAFQVLRVLAFCAGDFIRKRTIQDVFPALLAYFRQLQICAKTQRKRQVNNLLVRMTEGLWDFLAQLDLGEVETDLVMEEMIQYHMTGYKGNQRPLFKPVRLSDRDTLWLKMKLKQ